jgi:hypothetical protein
LMTMSLQASPGKKAPPPATFAEGFGGSGYELYFGRPVASLAIGVWTRERFLSKDPASAPFKHRWSHCKLAKSAD